MNSFDLLRPKTLKDALLVKDATVKAGGIDLLDRMKEGIDRPARLLDILPLAELRGIEEKDGAIHVGALVTLAELAASKLVREKATALAEAAHEAATPQVRAQATLGGNLFQHNRCWYYRSADFEPCFMRGGKECFAKDGRNKIHAIFATDGPCVAVHPSNLLPALIALGAVYEWKDAAGRESGFSLNPMMQEGKLAPTALEPMAKGALLTGVRVPIVAGLRSAYREFGERESFDWALASCAVTLALDEKGACTDKLSVVLGAVAPMPLVRTPEVLALLFQKKLTPELARKVAEKALEGAKPLAENGYKVPIARALVARALLAAAGMEEKK